jgi:hypothetical protein
MKKSLPVGAGCIRPPNGRDKSHPHGGCGLQPQMGQSIFFHTFSRTVDILTPHPDPCLLAGRLPLKGGGDNVGATYTYPSAFPPAAWHPAWMTERMDNARISPSVK